ncbi:MAG: ABC transporter permease [Chloroflexi bacterium OLB15]|nr:MAG: ABC transporter permease [Chloroflexi bacterium OLB15]
MTMARDLVSSKKFFVIVLLVPIILLVAILVYYPAIDTFGTSLTNENLRIRRPPEFIGLENYTNLLGSNEFWQVLGRSLLLVAVILPLETGVAFAIALLLNEKFPGRGIIRTLVIIPWMVPPVVNGFLWGWLLNGEYGALNGLLYQFGLIGEYQYWLRDPTAQVFWVAVVHTWTRFSFPMIILLAGLQGIPDDLYDAAKVDGAGTFSRLRRITVPMLLPSLAVALVIEFIAAFQIFDVIWTLTAGGSAGGAINPFTKTLMIYNYELIFRDLRIGLGAALSYLILLMSLGVGIVFITRLYNEGIKSR